MAKFEIVPGLKFVDRKGWGADTSLPRKGFKVARRKRTHVIIHHTVMPDADDSPNLWKRESSVFKMMRRLQVVRKKDLGADVPYSFVVFLMESGGKVIVCEGRGEDRSGAHTKGHNTAGIGVSFAGDFEFKEISDFEVSKRLLLVSHFLGWLKFSASHPDYGNFTRMSKLGSLRPRDRDVFIHQDFKATACPGKKIVRHVSQLKYNPTVFA